MFNKLKLMNWKPSFYLTSAILFSLLCHFSIQIKIDHSRLNLALTDILVPVFLSFVVCTKQLDRKILRNPLIIILAVITVWMTICLFVGRDTIGHWSTWALANKYLGWWAILSYFLFGYITQQNLNEEHLGLFKRSLILTTALVCLVDFIQFAPSLIMRHGYQRMEGALVTPATFSFLVMLVLFVALDFMKNKNIINRNIDKGIALLLLFAIIFSGTRTVWVATAFGALYLTLANNLKYLQMNKIIKSFGTYTLAILIILMSVFSLSFFFGQGNFDFNDVYIFREDFFSDRGISERVELNLDAIALITEKPIIGHGLGFFIENFEEKWAGKQIHNSYLWLWVETGFMGLALFVIFFALVTKKPYKKDFELNQNYPHTLLIAITISTFITALGFEVLYQRGLWFLLGIFTFNHGKSNVMKRHF